MQHTFNYPYRNSKLAKGENYERQQSTGSTMTTLASSNVEVATALAKNNSELSATWQQNENFSKQSIGSTNNQ